MKKLSVLLICFTILFPKLKAQETASENKVRFGLKIAPSLNWMGPDDKKKLTNDGVKLKFSYGLITEFRLSSVASFSTGIDINYSGGGLSYNNKDSVYYNPDEVKPAEGIINKFFIHNRSYKITYVDIPILLKLKVPEVNHFTYFGQFGVNLSIRAKAKANDIGNLVTYTRDTLGVVSTSTIEQTDNVDVIVTKDVSLLTLGLNVGLGAEYKIAGNAAIVFSVNFHNAFTNALKEKSDDLLSLKGINSAPFVQNAKINYFQFNVGILF
jgi:hypothetical protein